MSLGYKMEISIVYPFIKNKVRIEGAVQRPGHFEILEGETLKDLLKVSGLKDRNIVRYEYSRFNSSKGLREVQIYDKVIDINLQHGDSVNVFSNKNLLENNVFISGEFVILDSMTSVRVILF